jgi:hypothetical protein
MWLFVHIICIICVTAAVFRRPCGIFSFTYAAEFILHAAFPRHDTPAELVDKLCESQQIRDAEECTVLTHDDLRGSSREIRPLLRNRADCPIIILQQQALSIGIAPFAHTSELFPGERMKRVRDTYKMRRCDRSTCTLD